MNSRDLRRTAIGIGVLFWISNLVTLIGGVITGALPTNPAGLAEAHAHLSQVFNGTLLTHVNDLVVIGYAVLLYPVLSRTHPTAAAGYVAFKIVEGTMLLVAAAILLAAVQTNESPGADTALALQFWTTRLGAYAYLVATPILNIALFRTNLVPRWLSALGLIGCALLAVGIAIGVGDPARGFQPGQLLVIPIILWELTFATWLIAKGFTIMAPWPAPVTPATSSASWSPSTSSTTWTAGSPPRPAR